MKAEFRSWWQQIKQHLVTILVVAIILIMAIALIITGYRFDWTGFNGTNKSGKTLWDWLQLLIIPAILAVGGFWLNQIQRGREQRTTEQRDKTEREIALDNQREVALQAYIDKMSELLFEKGLRESQPEDEVRKIARVRTLTVLSRLDEGRKRSVLQFLHESGLIEKNEHIVDLDEADLRRTDLSGAVLSGANLHFSDLRKANLSFAKLTEADLRRVNLSEANLSEANLFRANLSEANLHGANLNAANLNGANLNGAFLSEANLSGTDLSGTNLHLSDLRKANLSYAKLNRADLFTAELSYANLNRADLNGANLSEANLYKADLREADLSDAILRGAKVTTEQLHITKSLKEAIMPDGTKHLE